uniref:Thiolase C-terminal domain-containing protein n=1 Tax=Emiliania huxleyi (strain CCMP1516) TaxID=280463 RepID=A0A0D3JSQ3_EMIH1
MTREQLAMVPVLASRQAMRHPLSLTEAPPQPRPDGASAPLSLDEVLASRPVAPATNLLECARRADGGAAFIVADSNFIDATLGHDARPQSGCARRIRDTSTTRCACYYQASGPLYPPPRISDEVFSCEHAAGSAYSEAQLLPSDIDWFGLYDCFPICYVRALEAVGLARKGEGGRWVERAHAATQAEGYEPSVLPVNTHGGLLGFGAPWEVPAMYNACDQLLGTAGQRQVGDVRRALVYGNGGIFSHSAVAILAQPVD